MFMSTSDSASDVSTNSLCDSSSCSFLSSPSSVSTSSSFSSTSSSTSECQVFLGGSCNPTTWRSDLAIPFLEEKGITYFNPQVSEWSSDLLLRENEAKRSAQVHFFVLDNQTRNTSAMIEVAFDLAKRITLVLVINDYKWPDLTIAGEKVSRSEFEELINCQNWIKTLAYRHSVPVFYDIRDALRETVRILKYNGHQLMPLLRSFQCNNLSDTIRLLPRATRTTTTTTTCRLAAINNLNSSHSSSIHQVTSNTFLTSNLSSSSYSLHDDDLIQGHSHALYSTVRSKYCNNDYLRVPTSYGCKNYHTQRRTTAHTMSSSDIPLFFISSNARSIIEMISAAYALGCEKRCILCIQDLPSVVVIDGESLSMQAIKDYNRGRAYLKQFAKSSDIPIYECKKEALHKYLTIESLKK